MRRRAAPQKENAYRDRPRLHGHRATLTIGVGSGRLFDGLREGECECHQDYERAQ